MSIRILQGDCRQVLKTLPDNSVDSVVCDPPYELGFMGKSWDSTGVANDVETWRQCLRVLKPGGHLLAFSGTRTQHRMVCSIEDAGFEIRDQIGWAFGSGFPKSLDVSKAIDKAAGAVRDCTRDGVVQRDGYGDDWDTGSSSSRPRFDNPATDAALQWQGWGTALKPAWEPICVARKPLHGTVAANVLKHGTGALNIDGCRVATDPSVDDPRLGGAGSWATDKTAKNVYEGGFAGERIGSSALGRWPANLLHDGSPEVVALFPQSSGQQADVRGTEASRTGGDGTNCYGEYGRVRTEKRGDSGSAARFFWCPKTSAADRHEGLQHPGVQFGAGSTLRDAERLPRKGNHHPTVKPTDLMRYLCRLVTPPGGTVLDPFMGSGSTLKAAELEGFSAIGIELDPAYIEIARRRIAADAPLFADLET